MLSVRGLRRLNSRGGGLPFRARRLLVVILAKQTAFQIRNRSRCARFCRRRSFTLCRSLNALLLFFALKPSDLVILQKLVIFLVERHGAFAATTSNALIFVITILLCRRRRIALGVRIGRILLLRIRRDRRVDALGLYRVVPTSPSSRRAHIRSTLRRLLRIPHRVHRLCVITTIPHVFAFVVRHLACLARAQTESDLSIQDRSAARKLNESATRFSVRVALLRAVRVARRRR
mmetsp:Transcript_8908/g.30070  ORF Transcript_8908/g.30070 Transcript_8908/m.30070 type:complete len:233 (+) Transcript_8908:4156-4854(+)